MENDKELIDWAGEFSGSDLFLQACDDISNLPNSEIDRLENIFWDNPTILHNIKTSWWDFSHNAMPNEMFDRLFSCIYIGWRMRELYEKDNF